ncbi:hypothetical protein U14_00151 [Candidatus Moduliflexus flocculans]|uniref:Uncharacterized protein n=1 Tax=Candidatus Moduliflexus flocculans TaxID=1499966 RepID=A0A0S6VPI4_9BACT|nr:hypothetical protein U14_00151 [Candidatus Moduliflexus flocculans]
MEGVERRRKSPQQEETPSGCNQRPFSENSEVLETSEFSLRKSTHEKELLRLRILYAFLNARIHNIFIGFDIDFANFDDVFRPNCIKFGRLG